MEELEAVLETGGAAAVELAASALMERGGHFGQCANCSEPLLGPYCAICGQPRDTHRRSLGHLLHDLVKDIASFDSRILRTAKALVLRPGELPLAFMEGRTQRYVPPVRLYLFVSLLFFLTLSVTGIAIVQFVLVAKPEKVVVEKGQVYGLIPDSNEKSGDYKFKLPAHYNDGQQHYYITSQIVFLAPEGSVHAKMSDATRQSFVKRTEEDVARAKNKQAAWIVRTALGTVAKLARDPAALNGALTAWIPRALFLLLPLFAMLVAAFYWRQRKKFYFVDHLVFSLSFHSFGFVLLLLAAAIPEAISGDFVVWLVAGVLGLYLLLAVKRFYRQSWLWTVLKTASIGVLYTTFFVLPAFAGIIVLSVLYG